MWAGALLTLGQLAGVIGLSAPMLSQLVSGQRAKIGNPAVLSRLQALVALADDAELPELSRAELARRIELVAAQDTTGVVPTTTTSSGRGAEAVQTPLRAVASPTEIGRAADLLDTGCPALALVLRVYGLGNSQSARVHWASIGLADDR
jgi:hypothetical protein